MALLPEAARDARREEQRAARGPFGPSRSVVEVPKPIAMGGKGKEILCMTFVPDGVAAAAGQEVVAYGCEDGLAHYVNTSPDAEPRVVNPVWMERNRRCFWSTDKFTGIAFGRGVHSCPGGPLARVEGRVSIERILDRMGNIEIDAAKHGAPGQRSYTYEPTFILRGLTELNITFDPVR